MMPEPCTEPPSREAWVLEAAADLTGPCDEDTRLILRAWRIHHGLSGTYHINTTAFGRERQPEDYDSLTLQVEATADQIRDLASRLSLLCGARIEVRRADLCPVPVIDMRTMQPTGEYMYIDPEVEERQLRKRTGDARLVN